jgi:hypothetical protein
VRWNVKAYVEKQRHCVLTNERSGGGLKIELYSETCRRRMLLMMGGVAVNLRVALGY